MRYIAALALVAAGWLGANLTHEDAPQPYCPTEDSCAVDYRKGEWHVEEVTP